MPIDFQSFYAAGYQVRTHPSQLYDLGQQQIVQHALSPKNGLLPFYHPSYETLLFVPFSYLPIRAAYLADIGFNMLLLAGCFWVARPAFSSAIPLWQRQPGLMFFFFLPAVLAALCGQDSYLSLLLYCLAWRNLESGREMSAGCFLALALFKFQLAIPIAALIGIRRGRRFAAGFLITAAAVAALCVGIVGWAATVEFIRVLAGAATAMNKSRIVKLRMGVYPYAMPNLAGLLYACGRRLLLPNAILTGLTAVCSLGLFTWCARAVRHTDQNTAFSIAILCGLLVSYHLFIYDLTLALLAVALLAGRNQRYIVLALFCLPLALLFFGSNAFSFLALPLLAVLGYAIVFASNQVATPLGMVQEVV